jgi:hypothetical protein
MSDIPEDLRPLLELQAANKEFGEHAFANFVKEALQAGVQVQTIIDACTDSTFAGKAIYQHVAANGGEDCVLEEMERVACLF